jgi:hypothetical protein
MSVNVFTTAVTRITVKLQTGTMETGQYPAPDKVSNPAKWRVNTLNMKTSACDLLKKSGTYIS